MRNSALFLLLTIILSTFILSLATESKNPRLKDILIDITDDTADQLSTGTWLINVHASFCGHCRQLAPTLDTVALQILKDRDDFTYRNLKIALINGPENPELNARFVKRGYPTLVLMKEGLESPYRGLRTKESLLHTLKTFSQPVVQDIQNRGHFKHSLGTLGAWNNLFIYLGPNTLSHGAFIDCAKQHQGNSAIFMSPFGVTSSQSQKLAQSLWEVYPGDYEQQYEVMIIDERQALLDLVDFFQLTMDDLPVVINYPVGRESRIYPGPFDSSTQKEMMCAFVEANINAPIEQLSSFNYATVVDNSDSFVIMGIHQNRAQDVEQLSVLPKISEKFNFHFDHFTWTLSPLIPKLKLEYGIPEYVHNFILVVDKRDEYEAFWVINEENFQDESTVLAKFDEIYKKTNPGTPLYSIFNPFPRLARKIGKLAENFTSNHTLFYLIVALISIILATVVGVCYICFFFDDDAVHISAVNKESRVLQQKLLAKKNNKQDKIAETEPFINTDHAQKINTVHKHRETDEKPTLEGEDTMRQRK